LRYVDLNPVRAGLVDRAADYRWSSARAHVEGRDPSGLLDLETWKQVCPCGDWAQALAWSNADEQLAERASHADRPPVRSGAVRDGLGAGPTAPVAAPQAGAAEALCGWGLRLRCPSIFSRPYQGLPSQSMLDSVLAALNSPPGV
jgi:hypothetical protein